MSDRASFLLVLGDPKGLAFVLREQRMAFAARRPRGGAMKPGDEIFLYVSRKGWSSVGHLIGMGTVLTAVTPLASPFALSGRRFVSGCDLLLEGLAPWRSGIELGTLVDVLDVFPLKSAWSGVIRRSLVPLPSHDAEVLRKELSPHLLPPDEVLNDYADRLERLASR